MRGRTTRGDGPRATADYLWEDSCSGDRLRISLRLDGERDADLVADLEATGFRRVNAPIEAVPIEAVPIEAVLAEAVPAEAGPAEGAEPTNTKDPRGMGRAEVKKDGEDGGTLPCSIDVVSAFHVPENELALADRATTDEDSVRDGRVSA